MGMALFTAETARLAGLRSVESRKLAKERPLVLPNQPLDLLDDPFIDGLACAQGEALKELREMIVAHKPSHAAQLARALRDLRETWHMATGKPKPGMIKPGSERPTRTLMPRVYPSNGVPGTGTEPNQPK